MKRRLTLASAVALVIACATFARGADGDFSSLLRRLPPASNAVVIVDAKAARQAIGAGNESAVAALGLGGIPVMAGNLALGAHIDFGEHRHVWSVAVFQVDGSMTIQSVAASEKEPVQQVGGHAAVLSPRNAYFIDIGPGLMAVGSPANRQLLSRWLQFQDANRLDVLSPYLLKATTPSTPFIAVMALDLENSFDPAAIRRGLDRSEVLASRGRDRTEESARLIASIKGLTFTVRPGSPVEGELSVEFGDETRHVATFAKDLLLEALRNAGYYLEDFDGWQELPWKDRFVRIHGPLSPNALRKLTMLIKTPVPSPVAAGPEAAQPADPAARAVAAAQRYFKSVTQILADLKADKGKNQNSRAGWYDQAADQMSALPTLDVPPELVGYGQGTADQLRAMAAGQKDLTTKVNYVRRNSYQSVYGWVYGNVQMGNVVPTQKVIQALEGQADQARRQNWEKIDQATEQLRAQMTQKFNVQF